jgi:citrate lyase subunit gamma (acyl carrier protein)
MSRAGSFESGDCIITIAQHDKLKITIQSTVYETFGDQIKATIMDVIKTFDLDKLHITCQDKGAFDYTIKARLIVALKRGAYIE